MGKQLSMKPADSAAFNRMLQKHGLELKRADTSVLQVNVGLICNQYCRHCHLSAGPDRKESMSLETLEEVASYAKRTNFQTIDITGGAPELNPHIVRIVESLAPLAPGMMFRSNLSAINGNKPLLDLLKSKRSAIVASFPSLNPSQADSQRGGGIFETSVDTLRAMNGMGYGQEDTGLELNLVSNPAGAFLPPSQEKSEERFRKILGEKWGIVFNNLYNFANTPLGRFRQWLEKSGNFDGYMEKLVSGFNPCAVSGVMCRTLMSVSWDGMLFDCDFNIARGLHMGGRKIHISEMRGKPEQGSQIAMADHCFACTAGAGFT